jgi:hypothetical protein
MIGLGASGSWVVQGSYLCGYIVAIQEDSPKAYMLPIEDVFPTIVLAAGGQPVRLVTKGTTQNMTQAEGPSPASSHHLLLPHRRNSNDAQTPQNLAAPVTDRPPSPTEQTFPTSDSTLRQQHTFLRHRLPKARSVLRPGPRVDGIFEKQSLLWPTLAILFPGVYESDFDDKACFRCLGLAVQLAKALYAVWLLGLSLLSNLNIGNHVPI